jgi:hypothetical protein
MMHEEGGAAQNYVVADAGEALLSQPPPDPKMRLKTSGLGGDRVFWRPSPFDKLRSGMRVKTTVRKMRVGWERFAIEKRIPLRCSR